MLVSAPLPGIPSLVSVIVQLFRHLIESGSEVAIARSCADPARGLSYFLYSVVFEHN